MDITNRTKISRLAKRGTYDEATIHAILDQAWFCNIAYVSEGLPFQIPTGFARIGSKLYIHGSIGSHFMRAIVQGIPVCISVTHADGLVLARSAFHHSMNYRSVVLFGKAGLISDDEEKKKVLEAFTEKLLKGRWDDTRPPDKKEMDKTMVLAFNLDEASAKVRSGGPVDDEEDYALPYWAGVLPVFTVFGTPVPDERLAAGIPLPPYLEAFNGH